jgi:hypothetical protein
MYNSLLQEHDLGPLTWPIQWAQPIGPSLLGLAPLFGFLWNFLLLVLGLPVSAFNFVLLVIMLLLFAAESQCP